MRLAVRLLQSRRDGTMSNPVMKKLCGALRNLGSEPTQNHCAASRRRCRSLDMWRQMKTRKPTFSHRFQRALLAPVHVPPLRGFGGGVMACPRFRFASYRGYSWCHASGVGCLRRNCAKPTLAHRNFGRAGSSVRAATHRKNFPSFPCFPWTKNGLWALAHAKTFRVVRG